jgi:predicted nucleic acid-binding protein
VAAIEHALSEPVPTSCYLDSDFLTAFTVPAHPCHEACYDFVERAARANTRAVINSLTWLEFVQAVSRAEFIADLPPDLRDRANLQFWESRIDVREAWIAEALDNLQALLNQFTDRQEVPINEGVRARAIDLKIQFDVDMADAVNVACAMAADTNNIVSFNEGYRRVDGLHLWNKP